MTSFIRTALLVSTLVLPLAACANGPSIDPTDIFDSELFNTKKKLPGERKEVFPEGTPGVPRGVPPELVRGYQPPAEPPPDPIMQAGAPREEPKPKPKAKPKPKLVERPAEPQGRPTAVTVRPSASPFPDPPASSQQPQRSAPQTSGPGQVQWPDPPPR